MQEYSNLLSVVIISPSGGEANARPSFSELANRGLSESRTPWTLIAASSADLSESDFARLHSQVEQTREASVVFDADRFDFAAIASAGRSELIFLFDETLRLPESVMKDLILRRRSSGETAIPFDRESKEGFGRSAFQDFRRGWRAARELQILRTRYLRAFPGECSLQYTNFLSGSFRQGGVLRWCAAAAGTVWGRIKTARLFFAKLWTHTLGWAVKGNDRKYWDVRAPYFAFSWQAGNEEQAVVRWIVQKRSVRKILDIGYGYGRMLQTYAELSLHVVAVDLSFRALTIAPSAAGTEKIVMNLGRPAFSDTARFDLVISILTLQHLSEEQLLECLTMTSAVTDCILLREAFAPVDAISNTICPYQLQHRDYGAILHSKGFQLSHRFSLSNGEARIFIRGNP